MLATTALIEFVVRLHYASSLYSEGPMFSGASSELLTGWLRLPPAFSVYIGTLFVGLCGFVILGLGGRASIAALFLVVTFLQERNTFIINGGDQFLRLMLFYLCFANTSAALSLSKNSGPSRSPWQHMLDRLVLLSILLQLCTVYFSSGLAKVLTPQWREGKAYYYLVTAGAFGGQYLYSAVRRWHALSYVVSYATLVFEFGFPLFIWFRRTRNLALLAGCLFHLGIAHAMNLYAFQTYFLLSYIIFVDPARIDRGLAWFRSHLRLVPSAP